MPGNRLGFICFFADACADWDDFDPEKTNRTGSKELCAGQMFRSRGHFGASAVLCLAGMFVPPTGGCFGDILGPYGGGLAAPGGATPGPTRKGKRH